MKKVIHLIGIVSFTLLTNAAVPADAQESAEAVQRRVAAKVERVKEGARKWEASGRSPSAIAMTMREKVGPLLEAGKFAEAEPELDRVLEQLALEEKGTTPPTTSAEAVQQRVRAKIERLTQAVQKMAASGSDPSAILKMVEEKVKPLMDAGKVSEAEPELDRVLEQLPKDTNTPTGTQGSENKPQQTPSANTSSDETRKRLTAKVERVKAGVQRWMTNGRDPSEIGKTMGEKFKPLMDAGNVAEAEAVVDGVLKQLEQDENGTATPGASGEAVQQRVAAKVERVTQGVQKWAAIGKTMEEKVKPLLAAGKFAEAETELDRVLDQRTKEPTAPASAPAIAQDASSYEERLPPKIHRIQKGLPAWSEKPGNQEKATAFMQKLKEQLDAMNFAEADKIADAILETMGLSTPAAGQSGETKPQQSPPGGAPTNETAKRVTEKVQRITQAVQKMAAGGRDPSAFLQTMREKVGPLLDAGKIAEAEPELDRVLEQLNKDAD